MLYAVAQGFFLGAASEAFEQSGPASSFQRSSARSAAFIATLAAYKFFNIQVSTRIRKFGSPSSGMGFFVLVFGRLPAVACSAPSSDSTTFGALGLLMSVLGLGLGIFFLILDFDMIERGVAMGAPESESWRAAFGLTATLMFIYIELLRIIAILRGDVTVRSPDVRTAPGSVRGPFAASGHSKLRCALPGRARARSRWRVRARGRTPRAAIARGRRSAGMPGPFSRWPNHS